MAYQLEFDRILRDDFDRDGIFLPVALHHGELNAQGEAQIDTGASCCSSRANRLKVSRWMWRADFGRRSIR